MANRFQYSAMLASSLRSSDTQPHREPGTLVALTTIPQRRLYERVTRRHFQYTHDIFDYVCEWVMYICRLCAVAAVVAAVDGETTRHACRSDVTDMLLFENYV